MLRYNIKNKHIILVSNVMILLIVLAVVLIQYNVRLSLLESRLINTLYIVPLFISVLIYNVMYGVFIIVLTIATDVIFPLPAFTFSISSIATIIIQVVFFILLIIFMSEVKKMILKLKKSEDKESGYKMEITDNRNDLLNALLKAIDEKDSYTYHHSKRVAYYAKILAFNMSIPKEEIENIYIAGMLHDIGKIGIKDSVLNKGEALNKSEIAEIREHPIIGARIAENLNYMKDIIPGIYYHHEYYDGSGYPDKIKGEEIPLISRILSIVDAFDAITTDRPYRKASAFNKAADDLIKGIGKQFDPEILVKFVDMINKNEWLLT